MSANPRSEDPLKAFEKLFGRDDTVIIGAVHVDALPGSPLHSKSLDDIIAHACSDAEKYVKHGLDGLIFENTNDIPYLKQERLSPETTACMTRVCAEVRRKFPQMPMGVQILAEANLEAMAVAQACDLNFIRAEGFVFSSVGDQGIVDACAGELLRFRKTIGAESVKIFADIRKHHNAHAITADLKVQDVAHAAEFFLADGVIISGERTGKAADPQEAAVTMKKVDIPVLLGSGVTADTLHAFANNCHGMIVGSEFKKGGLWYNDVDEGRVKKFMDNIRELRETLVKAEKHSHRKPALTDYV
ncbi:uncharacterized protein F13E9.13, mitochondrial-like [Paramacrobiotus metropolitanus]|uniref:uncharacterized protein F13E9.13, mitochondrial-like n=1 Tax=Paramacrobiotus metropolitanus TaxID=2943436 RepID=UPI0024463647|nr:uncharacterized protein F13E9.13, mitochondrial-like [Paramacrobiotus metropolitanus]